MQRRYGEDDMVQLYTVGYKERVLVPARDILHMPYPMSHNNEPLLCKRNKYCTCGVACRFVHACTENMQMSDPGHVNFAWRNLGKCKYERLPAGEQYTLSYPADYLKSQSDTLSSSMPHPTTISSEYIIKTKAIEQAEDANICWLVLCRHFLQRGICDKGAECEFAHIAYIDENAKPYQRAPCQSRRPRRPIFTWQEAPPAYFEDSMAMSVSPMPASAAPSPPVRTRPYSYRHDPYAAEVIPAEYKSTPVPSEWDEVSVHSASTSSSVSETTATPKLSDCDNAFWRADASYSRSSPDDCDL